MNNHLDRTRQSRRNKETIHDSSADRALWELAESAAAIADALEARSEPVTDK
jgi:hypothetical protein